ncbi:MAG: hypothetical protein DRR19_29580 [Candidatus Parabeggiatoa sp. nov. 1]|nr:MAG: hypothetical protein DRR19_29580 [Gammaproteobacteria bacterium]
MRQGFSTYLQECLRLLYWTYFKPYTFRQWLREIHPTLDIYDNPFKDRAAFADNPRLKRYADQVAWLTLLTPFVIAFLVAMPYSLYSEKPFLWSKSLLFLCGWSLGVLLATHFNPKLQEWLYKIVVYGFGILLLWLFGILPKVISIFPNGETWVIQIAIFFQAIMENMTVIYPLAFGVALGVANGVAFNVAISVAFSAVIGVAFCVAIGAAFGVAIGAAISVAIGVAFGVAIGVAFGVV